MADFVPLNGSDTGSRATGDDDINWTAAAVVEAVDVCMGGGDMGVGVGVGVDNWNRGIELVLVMLVAAKVCEGAEVA